MSRYIYDYEKEMDDLKDKILSMIYIYDESEILANEIIDFLKENYNMSRLKSDSGKEICQRCGHVIFFGCPCDND